MADLKILPPSLNLTVWAGGTSTITFQWPDGALEDRTFTAAITDPRLTVDDPDVNIVGDAIIVVIPGDTSETLEGNVARFELIETTSGRDEVVIAGALRATLKAGTPTSTTVEVIEGEATVTVTVGASLGDLLAVIDGGTPTTGDTLLVIDGGTP